MDSNEPRNAMASEIIGNSMFVQQLFHAGKERDIKAPQFRSFVSATSNGEKVSIGLFY